MGLGHREQQLASGFDIGFPARSHFNCSFEGARL